MGWRQVKLAHFGDQLGWLDESKAAATYDRGMAFCSKSHYGPDPAKFVRIERLDVDDSGTDSSEWLAPKLDPGPVLIVFSHSDVCQATTSFFIENWRDLFCPSRDDVIILPKLGDWVLFYCHEDEFEYGVGPGAV
jgi:hypothetical protein